MQYDNDNTDNRVRKLISVSINDIIINMTYGKHFSINHALLVQTHFWQHVDVPCTI